MNNIQNLENLIINQEKHPLYLKKNYTNCFHLFKYYNAQQFRQKSIFYII